MYASNFTIKTRLEGVARNSVLTARVRTQATGEYFEHFERPPKSISLSQIHYYSLKCYRVIIREKSA